MSDPLSIVASVAGLVSISAKIISMLKDLYDCGMRAKQAPESISHLMGEMQDMSIIFCQVQQFILGTTRIANQSSLKMVSIQHLVATLSGCVLIASNLDKYLSEVVGVSDSSSTQPPAHKASRLLKRIKWALWKEAEVAVFIEDLQRHKLSLNLMLGIIQCHTAAEASEKLERLHEAVYQILESNHAISIQLRELISCHDSEISKVQSSKIHQPEVASILPAKRDLRISLSAIKDDQALDDNDDTVSFRTAATSHSTFSLRSIQLVLPSTSFMDELRSSRPYRRIQRWSISSDSYTTFSSTSSTRGCSWSMLSDMSLGDLTVSEISVIVLPICFSDLWDSQPYQVQIPRHSAVGRYISRQKLKWSSLRGIHYAIRGGNENVVRTLLTLGTNIEKKDSKGRTPLAYAASLGQESICKLLWERGASIEGIIHSAIQGRNENIVRTLLALGIDIEEKDSKGRTPLAYAASTDQESICKLLLERGASIQGTIHGAIDGGNENFIQHLLSLGVYIEEKNSKGLTPLAHAASMGYENICKLLLERGANTQGVLHIAIHQGNENVVRDLLASGADIEENDLKGLTPLAHAAYMGHENICKLLLNRGASMKDIIHSAILKGNENMIRILLPLGVDIEERDLQGQTPLIHAVYMGHENICKLLLDRGANMEGIIHGAILKGNENVIRTLLALGADIEERDSKGRTPLAYAAYMGRESICKLLLERGASEEMIASITPPIDLTHSIYNALNNGDCKNVVRLLRKWARTSTMDHFEYDIFAAGAMPWQNINCTTFDYERGGSFLTR